MGDENNEKSALVPRRRFSKFSEAWRAYRVGEIAEIFKGKGIAKSDISNDGIHPCIRYGELYTVYGELVTEVVSRTSLPATDLFFGEPNDVIIPSSGETKEDIATAACVAPGGIAFGGDLNVLRTKENGAFLSYYLNGPLRNIIARVAQGDSVVHLYPHQIEKLPIAVPVRNEQQKIADCLSSLDELITAESQALTALKTHKKGLMQQLFPREGETVPHLRFPEFLDDNRSGLKAIGEFAKVTTGGRDTQNKVDDGEYPFFVRSQSVERIDSYSYDGEAVLTSGDGVGVGENYHYINGRFDFHQRVYCIYGFDDSVSGRFFYLYFASRFKKRVKQMSAKNSVDSVRMPMITEMPIWVPRIEEQEQIADCLFSLDDLITAQSQKIDALKTHKKGLMQQLFPVLDEVQA